MNITARDPRDVEDAVPYGFVRLFYDARKSEHL